MGSQLIYVVDFYDEVCVLVCALECHILCIQNNCAWHIR